VVMDWVLENKRLQHEKSQRFVEVFGVPLRRFMDPILGFDIVRFDDQVIRPPDGTSTRDVIVERYGEEAVRLVEELIGIKEE